MNPPLSMLAPVAPTTASASESGFWGERSGVRGLYLSVWLIAIFAGAQTARSQSIVDGAVTLSANANPVTAKVAMPIELTITITSPVGVSLFPPVIESSLGSLTVTSKTASRAFPIDGKADRTSQKYVYTLESLTSGTTTIPSLEFRYQLPGMTTGPRKLISPPIEIAIISELAEDEDPLATRELKDSVDPSSDMPVGSTWWWMLVPAAVIAAIIHRRRRSRLTPQQWATKQIESVRVSTADGDNKLASLERCSTIIRQFIEYQSSIETRAMSSSELIAAVQSFDWPIDSVNTLRQFCDEIDGIKFAGGLTSDTTVDVWCDRLQNVIDLVPRSDAEVE